MNLLTACNVYKGKTNQRPHSLTVNQLISGLLMLTYRWHATRMPMPDSMHAKSAEHRACTQQTHRKHTHTQV